MAPTPNETLLAKLARADADGSDPFLSLTATEPEHEEQEDEKLNALLARINQKMAEPEEPAQTTPAEPESSDLQDIFVPTEPSSFREAGLTDTEVEALILKYLMARGDATGHDVADQIRLPFILVDELLRQLKIDQLVVHKGSAPMNDYQYQLSDVGRERARRYYEQCSYFGSAPVILSDYIAGVEAQSLAGQRPTAEAPSRGPSKTCCSTRKCSTRLGPAVNSGRGLFLFGPPGNGKTQYRRTRGRPSSANTSGSRAASNRRHHRPRLRPHQPRGSSRRRTLGPPGPTQDRQTLGPHSNAPPSSPAAN